jgi:hypothetical protein
VAAARERYRTTVAAEQERSHALHRAREHEEQRDQWAARLVDLQREAALQQEEADDWNGRGFVQLALWLFGRLDERRDLESAQAMAAAARLATAHEAWAETDRAAVAARAAIAAPHDLAAAMADLRGTLERLEPHTYAWVVQCEQQAAAVRAELTEIEEALRAVDACSEAVSYALRQLRSAANWGTWDLLGGGLMVSAVKRGKVEDALGALGQVATALVAVRRELADVPTAIALPTGIEMGSGAWTFDVWFDNIFSDLNMQQRINDATTQAEGLAGRLAAAHAQLGALRRQVVDRSMRADAAAMDALRGR